MKKDLKIISIIITFTGILVLTLLIMNKGVMNLLDKPLSAIGNIPENYLMFLLGGCIVFYFVTLFLIKIHIKENIKISWELYTLPVLIILTLLIPYNEEFILGKILHTISGIVVALLIVYLMYRINKYYFSENPLIKKITKNIPTITIIGTLILFITTGLNVIMQLFYLLTTLIWINLTAFSKPKKNKKINKRIRKK